MNSSDLYLSRKRSNIVGLTLSMLAMSVGLVALVWILFVLLSNGFDALQLSLFIKDTPAPGSEGGGLRNAIVGSLMIVSLSVLVSTPVGILAGIYLTEYGDKSKTAELTRFVTFHRAWPVRLCGGSCNSGSFLRVCRKHGLVIDRHTCCHADH